MLEGMLGEMLALGHQQVLVLSLPLSRPAGYVMGFRTAITNCNSRIWLKC